MCISLADYTIIKKETTTGKEIIIEKEMIIKEIEEEMKECMTKRILITRFEEKLNKREELIQKQPKRWKFSLKKKSFSIESRKNLQMLNKNSKRHVLFIINIEKEM